MIPGVTCFLVIPQILAARVTQPWNPDYAVTVESEESWVGYEAALKAVWVAHLVVEAWVWLVEFLVVCQHFCKYITTIIRVIKHIPIHQ